MRKSKRGFIGKKDFQYTIKDCNFVMKGDEDSVSLALARAIEANANAIAELARKTKPAMLSIAPNDDKAATLVAGNTFLNK